MVELAPHKQALISDDREHLGIALALNVPVMVVITKIDICPPHILQQTITQLTKILKSPGARKIPIMVKTREDTINTAVSGCDETSSEALICSAMSVVTDMLFRRHNSSVNGYAQYFKCQM